MSGLFGREAALPGRGLTGLLEQGGVLGQAWRKRQVPQLWV